MSLRGVPDSTPETATRRSIPLSVSPMEHFRASVFVARRLARQRPQVSGSARATDRGLS